MARVGVLANTKYRLERFDYLIVLTGNVRLIKKLVINLNRYVKTGMSDGWTYVYYYWGMKMDGPQLRFDSLGHYDYDYWSLTYMRTGCHGDNNMKNQQNFSYNGEWHIEAVCFNQRIIRMSFIWRNLKISIAECGRISQNIYKYTLTSLGTKIIYQMVVPNDLILINVVSEILVKHDYFRDLIPNWAPKLG